MAGYVQKWVPPPTIDDYMFEVAQNIWWNEKDRAKRQLVWLMEKYLGDENDQETALREGSSHKG